MDKEIPLLQYTDDATLKSAHSTFPNSQGTPIKQRLSSTAVRNSFIVSQKQLLAGIFVLTIDSNPFMKKRTLLIPLALFSGLALYFSVFDSNNEPAPALQTEAKKPLQDAIIQPSSQASKAEHSERPLVSATEEVSNAEFELPEEAGSLADEWTLKFGSQAELEKAIAEAQLAGITVKGSIPAIGVAHFATNSDAQKAALSRLAENATEVGANYPVGIPTTPGSETSPFSTIANTPFGLEALDYLGVENNADWGQGITVAVLDTGVSTNSALEGSSIRQISLLENSYSADPSGHGTAVVSLIGSEQIGVSPGADIISLQVLDGNGNGDSFTIASGIVRAVDEGARVINLSLGSYGDSPALRDAVAYAQNQGVAIVAAAGNDGIGTLAYPAAYPGVVGVAAVDANSQAANFSNYGAQVDIAAPGVGIAAAGPDNNLISFSGTSSAAPLVTAGLTKILADEPFLTTQQAVDKLTTYTNDSGAPGTDEHYGQGILNLGRIEQSFQSGVYDAAISDYYVDYANATDDNLNLYITVQNRGTEYLPQVAVDYSVNGIPQTAYLGNLNANEVGSVTVPLGTETVLNGTSTRVESNLRYTGPADASPENNQRAAQLQLTIPE